MLLKGIQQKVEIDKVSTLEEYEIAVTGSTNDDKKVEMHWVFELAFEALILSVDCKTAFRLINNYKATEYPEGNCHLTWNWLVKKYAPKLAPSILSLKKQFENSRPTKAIDNPNAWIIKLEDLPNQMDEIGLASAMTDDDIVLHVVGILPKEYEATLINLDNCFSTSGSDKLIIEIMHQRYKWMQNKWVWIEEEEKVLAAIEKQVEEKTMAS